MANTKPCTITELCKQFDLDFYELLICCVFCRRQLEGFEKWSFMNKELFVVWEKHFPFAVCPKCLEIRAIIDLLRSFERAGSEETVEEDTGVPLIDLRIRCYGCYKPLTTTEKRFHVEDGKLFNKIANNWRGLCTNCTYLPSRLQYYFFCVVGRTPQPPIPGLVWGFDHAPSQLEISGSDSSWTTSSLASSISSGRRDDNLSDAESDGDTEILI
ncbi:E6 protein [Delphinus delphis papillomavirus 1]|uniref:Protein E6 n=1 Tax=Delphinus delphis papillomavirus TaxID=706524 RepID=F2VIQ0_9PAPI|nr:E6 protein [Delphinus delphis papillomavirus]